MEHCIKDGSFVRRRIKSASKIDPGADRIRSDGLIPLADPILPDRISSDTGLQWISKRKGIAFGRNVGWQMVK